MASSLTDLPGAISTSRADDVMEVCRIAKVMQLPIARMQQAYNLFKEYVDPIEDGASFVADGRLSRQQFSKIVGHITTSADSLSEWKQRSLVNMAFQTSHGKEDG